MTLTIVLAARGRPHLLLDTVRKTLANVVRSDTKFLISLDTDDAITVDAMDDLPHDRRILVSVKPREDGRGDKYNRALDYAPADVYFMMCDSAPVVTPGFDQMILNCAALFPDGIGCVYTQMETAAFPGYLAITAKMAALIGHIYSPEYPYWFIDHELDDIARMIGRYVCTGIQIQVEPHKTHRMRDVGFWAKYFQLSTLRRRQKAWHIINSKQFKCPRWQRQMLQTWHRPVEARSSAINFGLVEQAAAVEEVRSEPQQGADPGYDRIKAAAEARAAEMLVEAEALGFRLVA